MNIKEFKPYIGSEIWTIPTGNSTKRGVSLEEQIESTILHKVGREILTTDRGAFKATGEANKHNFGYIHFLTEQAAKEHLLASKMSIEVSNLFRYGNKFTYNQLKQVLDILKD